MADISSSKLSDTNPLKHLIAPAPKPEPRKLPPLPSGEWMYKFNDNVYGPVDSKELVDRMLDGTVLKDTPVARSDGDWEALSEIKGFAKHLKIATQKLEEERKAMPKLEVRKGRPSKRERRQIIRLRGH